MVKWMITIDLKAWKYYKQDPILLKTPKSFHERNRSAYLYFEAPRSHDLAKKNDIWKRVNRIWEGLLAEWESIPDSEWKKQSSEGVPCTKCRGTGVAKTIVYCGGYEAYPDGTENIPCDTCNGKGSVPADIKKYKGYRYPFKPLLQLR